MPELANKDACDLLDADHVAVKHLFVEYARLAMVTPDATADREPLARRICADLTVHAQVEEEIFYPALREVIDEPDLLDHATEEHQQAKGLVARIEGLPQAGPEMDELVTRLVQVVEHHVKEERTKIFSKARSAPALDLFALAGALMARQQELEASTPSSPRRRG
ncbi:MAG TPA: hemerythrin domain-containing protein, partial [Ramlibacter sp.]|nr:hemerythrin domain-containing protein [Ramlibacter sp.]